MAGFKHLSVGERIERMHARVGKAHLCSICFRQSSHISLQQTSKGMKYAHKPCARKSFKGNSTMKLSDALISKFVHADQFTLQRYKLRELIAELPKQTALSLIRHCFECNYLESETLYTAFTVEKG